MPTHPTLTVVVPVRDGAATIVDLLDALARQVEAPGAVVLVDDASTDATADLVADHPLDVRVVPGPAAGSYAARNAGVAAIDWRWDAVAFTDADCRPDPTWVAGLRRALAAGADLVGGRIVQELSPSPTTAERYDAALYLDQRELVDHAGFAATANLAVSRAALERLGGFDETLRSSGDLDLGRRAAAAGCRLVYAADAVVRHRPRRTTRALWRLHRRLGAGWAALARRDGGPSLRQDPRLRLSLGTVVERVARDGAPLRRRHLVVPHTVALGARLVGRVTGR